MSVDQFTDEELEVIHNSQQALQRTQIGRKINEIIVALAGGGGLSEVTHDASLSGKGTVAQPLSVVPAPVDISQDYLLGTRVPFDGTSLCSQRIKLSNKAVDIEALSTYSGTNNAKDCPIFVYENFIWRLDTVNQILYRHNLDWSGEIAWCPYYSSKGLYDSGSAATFFIKNGYIYFFNNSGVMCIERFKLSDRNVDLGSVQYTDTSPGVNYYAFARLFNNKVYVYTNAGYEIWDLSTDVPSLITVFGPTELGSSAWILAVDASGVYVANGTGLHRYDLDGTYGELVKADATIWNSNVLVLLKDKFYIVQDLGSGIMIQVYDKTWTHLYTIPLSTTGQIPPGDTALNLYGATF